MTRFIPRFKDIHFPKKKGVNVISAWLDRALQLPPRTTAFISEHDVAIRMRDGVTLRADIYRPVTTSHAPTVLARSPYGRGRFTALIVQIFASRGYNTVIQSCRGTFGSGGEFNPIFNEQADGLDTVGWIEAQPWYAGKLGLYGGSYLGMVQWAIAAELGNRLSAMAASVTTSHFADLVREGGGLRLQDLLTWVRQIDVQERHNLAIQLLKRKIFGDPLGALYKELPLDTLDIKSVGHVVDYWRDWTRSDRDDPYWNPIRFTETIDRVKAPVSMVAGWSDIFFPAQMRDFRLLRAAGTTTRMTIGPWTHSSMALMGVGLRDALEWVDFHLCDKAPSDASDLNRLRYWVNGTDVWRDTDSWPPVESAFTHLILGADGSLARSGREFGIRSFTYDPTDPTPSLAGPALTNPNGRGDVSALSTRADVLTFDSSVLSRDIEIVGNVIVELTTSVSSPYHDLFVCLCDVDDAEIAINITDGYQRLSPIPSEQSQRRTKFEAAPVAWRLCKGHRIRLLVAAGAFPRYSRNLGPAYSEGDGVVMSSVDINIHCGADDASSLTFFSREVEQTV
jgi:putative CocE/NonD family hydrolase